MEPAHRDVTQHGNWVDVQHHRAEDCKATPGDTNFDFTAGEKDFTISGSEYMGRDRDNYDYSHDVEIALNEDEVREVYLLMTVWLEQRS
jgi:hypothetical protein